MRFPLPHIVLSLLLAAGAAMQTARAQEPVREKLERLAAAQVAETCPGCGIEAVARWMPGSLAEIDSSAVRIVRLPASELNRGYVNAEAVWSGSGGQEHTSPVQFHIGVTAGVAVATRRIGEGEALEQDLYQIKRIDITRLRELPAGGPDELKGKTASRLIQEGSVILRTDISRPAVVEPGDPIRMYYRGEGMAISISTTARESKAPGEEIRLYSKETGRTYIATLINSSEAEWEQTL